MESRKRPKPRIPKPASTSSPPVSLANRRCVPTTTPPRKVSGPSAFKVRWPRRFPKRIPMGRTRAMHAGGCRVGAGIEGPRLPRSAARHAPDGGGKTGPPMTASASRPLPPLKALTSIAEVSATEWDALFGPSPAPFVRHAWLSAMEESGSATPATGWTPTHLTLWQEDALVAAVPAYLKAHSFGEYIYDFAWAQASERAGLPYYPKLVLGAPLSPATTQRFGVGQATDAGALRALLMRAAVALAQELGASGVHVLFCTREEAEALASAGFAHRTSLQFHWQNPGYGSLEDYLGRFNAKRRHQLRRELQAPRAQGVEITTIRGEALRKEH